MKTFKYFFDNLFLKALIYFSKKGLLSTGLIFFSLFIIFSTADAKSPVAGKTIGLSQSYATDEWLKEQRNDIITAAENLGMKVIATDAQSNAAQEIRNLEDLAVRGVDAVIMITYYADSVGVGVKALNDAGIPIIVMSSALKGDVDYAAHLAADTLGTAKKAGQYYVKELDGKGKVVQIEGRPGSLVNQARGKGWRDVIDATPGIEIVAHGIANYSRAEALKLMQDFLQANKEIDAVYCHNDNMAKGALQAIEEAGRQDEMWITGYDGLAVETLQMIADGKIRGTFVYPTFGAEAVEVTSLILQGKKVPKEIVFPSPMITKENLSQFYDVKTKKRLTPKADLKSLGL